ncbi:STAS domain-containing protein [Synechococcus sp. R55.6]|jgi:anti-anti-sigma factor|uniref:STAS domain-containing protein n=1 Tax=unclassified Synechococcus TaxID=2626047 RepID=UPI000069519D|nr:STAS domain-containing protein [Synechococcus sp. JA-2-3B'a(2-13)]ABD03135.1 anti-anti-sigma factor family protein [Synechococcus sp. JA-2-3B'a(2-13)]MDT7945278.1 STAS domain-containing protein [Cyanobacteriota bacterium PSP.bin.10]
MVERRRAIPEPLSLTVSLRGSREALENCQVFHLTGLLDAFSEPVFVKVVTKYLEEGSPNLILDLTGIDFIDSSGVGALVQLAKLVQGRAGIFQVVSNPRITQTVKLVRLEKFLSLRNSLQEALDRLKEGSTGSTETA